MGYLHYTGYTYNCGLMRDLGFDTPQTQRCSITEIVHLTHTEIHTSDKYAKKYNTYMMRSVTHHTI